MFSADCRYVAVIVCCDFILPLAVMFFLFLVVVCCCWKALKKQSIFGAFGTLGQPPSNAHVQSRPDPILAVEVVQHVPSKGSIQKNPAFAHVRAAFLFG